MAAPTYVADIGIVGNDGGSPGDEDLEVVLPSHQADDIALIHVITFNALSATMTDPDGWTQIATWDEDVTTTESRHWLYGRRLTSGSEANPVFTRSDTTNAFFAAGALYRGCITSGTAWEVVGSGQEYSAEPCVIPGITTLTAESLVVVTIEYGDNDASSATVSATDPSSFAVHYQETAIGFDCCFVFAEAARTTAGATGDITVDFDVAFASGRGAGGIALALKPPGGGGGDTVVSPYYASYYYPKVVAA